MKTTSVQTTSAPNHHDQSGQSSTKYIALIALILVCGLGGFYLMAKQQKAQKTEIEQLRAENRELDPLREQVKELDKLRRLTAQIQQLRLDNQELVKLRGEVVALRPVKDQLAKLQAENTQLRATVQQLQKVTQETASLRNQNQKLQGALAEQQQTAEAMAQTVTCISNLKSIEAAKAAWAADNEKTEADVPTDPELFGPGRYLPQKPLCPAGGTYTIGTLQEKPSCSVAEHAY